MDREDDATELLRLRTVAVGRGAAASPVPSGDVVAAGPRVEVRRPGIVEWYENSAAGLEQGWTFAERREGDGPLAVEVDFGRPVTRVVGNRAETVARERRLEYGGLLAKDANGAPLEARMDSASDGRVRWRRQRRRLRRRRRERAVRDGA